jgi:hypothetical protein
VTAPAKSSYNEVFQEVGQLVQDEINRKGILLPVD